MNSRALVAGPPEWHILPDGSFVGTEDFVSPKPGMPFLAGFYSKDLILEMVLLGYINFFGFILFFVSTGLTVCYSFRLFYYVLNGDFNFSSFYLVSENNSKIFVGMSGLLIIAVFGGRLRR
jgi:NADH-ubiquinone oxidoreductase chain 5